MTIDERSQQVARVFDAVSDTYDAVGVPFFGPIAAGLVDALDPRTGEVALDVGCGKGAATFVLSDRVGATGHVFGLDVSARMLDHARHIGEARGVLNVEWMLGDALRPQLPVPSVDLVASSLVLFFLPDPPAALSAWSGLMRPGGRLGVTTFGAFDPTVDALGDLLDPYFPSRSLDPRVEEAQRRFASDDGVELLLTEAGFVDVATRHLPVAVTLEDLEHWEAWSKSVGQRAAWDGVPAEQLDPLRVRAAQLFDAAADANGTLHTVNDIRITLGRTPA